MRSKRSAILVIASVVVISAILAGCSGGGTAKTVKIGFIGPLTGDVKTFGESTKNGFLMALEKHNNTAGGYKIESVIADDRNDPTEAVNVATKLITQEDRKSVV